MLARSQAIARVLTPAVGATALVSWAIAVGQAVPRLMAGPICSSRTDSWSLAGHCPACFAAVAFTVLFVVLAAATPRVNASAAACAAGQRK
ncbi:MULTISPECIES: hypothetical protein [Caulobacter]|jgi:hypothetical protein|uniref:Uncharacterized protein n=1 Tax=Caulobacter vibrioides OR37 TaxID=1292034 RepID=R0EGY9_CAUVI|nr:MULTISPECIES: hypothetical protein [Caulobacter]ENZ81289.1 hypothetical protein OR37_02847 [Caulobacter vibrioides OR37]MBQ1560032.1 hypothetical protein [Caulobacter sp.]